MPKKKIKDLTKEELNKICEKQKMCYNCPLNMITKDGDVCLKKELIRLNEEIEV